MKLRKRLPESRAEKRERLKSEKQNRLSERELALRRKELWLRQQEESREVWKVWRRAVKHRLDSDASYAEFEKTHLALWDWFRHVGMPDAEATLAMQRRADGKPFSMEPLVNWVASGPRRADSTLWRWVAATPLDPDQKRAIGAMVLRAVDRPYCFRGFRRLGPLVRTSETAWLRGELMQRANGATEGGVRERARWLLAFLDRHGEFAGNNRSDAT